MGGHSVARLALIVLSVVIFIICIIFNALAGPGTGPFRNNTGGISDKYNTEITPSGWTFSIWGVIYTWLSLMHIYILTTTCNCSHAICASEKRGHAIYAEDFVARLHGVAW